MPSGGETYDVPHLDMATPLDMTYRVALDLTRASSPSTAVNAGLNSVARFLNLHARAGVPPVQVQLAVIVHSGAARDLLKNDAYRERTGEDNPNATLVRDLKRAGVRVIVCGQTAAASGFTKATFLDEVEVALSAMTAFAALQERGYTVNPF